ncbi:hypothetical protein CXB49_16450 [Chromobacterium sp. ATCC 53434]|uniref:hypothetical protein n=1 Tax=Chromobacterium TaxID=535 RepID=UPI000C756C62|nr:hypothetical protein [Chromobacterium sp. ATCC 53434]AUH52289.1 hypothetical protein CXB49_16450 [Chromobacterium sp. ATCC 53434]
MRRYAVLLPLALCSAPLAASPLPSYDFALKPAIAPTPRITPAPGDEKPKPLGVQPRVRLGDLDNPPLEVAPSTVVSGARGAPTQPDSFSIGHSFNPSGPVQLQPASPGQPFRPGTTIDPQTGQQRAIPMHMLPPLPPYQQR